MPHLSIRLLGPFQVTLDDRPITGFESDKVRALLAYLAVERDRAHRREKLAGLLWPEFPEKTARANLRGALWNLRRCLGDAKPGAAFLRVTRQTIRLEPEGDTWCDVAAFDHRVAARGRPKRVMQQLAEAAELYRGGFLEGFSLPDSAAFEEWALLVRERLLRLVVDALQSLSRWLERQGEYRQALPHARRLVSLEPWQEEGHRQVMRLLALSKDRNGALVQYRGLRRLLADELEVEPEQATTELYQRIRDNRALLDECPGPAHNLPVPLTPFVGRERELDEIYARLARPDCRLLTLVGAGGSGKTRLALEAAGDLLAGTDGEGVAHGVYFVPLAPLRSVEAIVPAVAEALGFVFEPGSDQGQQLLDYLRAKRLLLVLDNFEHLLDGTGWVVEVLKAAPGVRLLVTSRARLNLQAEHLLPVAGMAVPDEIGQRTDLDPDELLRYDGVDLFVQGAARVRPGFCLTRDEAEATVRICRLVGGIPLAILLAAAWLERTTAAEIAAQLASEMELGLDLLVSDWQDLPERQRGMRAVFEHSWRLLDANEREILQGLSVFRGSFSRLAAREVAGALARDLSALVRRSLLAQTPAGRYEMHELLRQYAAEKLACAPSGTDREGLRERHCAFYSEAAGQWGTDLQGGRQRAALAEMELDFENVRAAWGWAAGRHHLEPLDRAMEGIGLCLQRLGRYPEGEQLYHRAAESLASQEARVAGGDSSQRGLVLARILAWQGAFLDAIGRTEEAMGRFLQSLELLPAVNPTGPEMLRARAATLLKMGDAALNYGAERARPLLEEALTIYEQLGDRAGRASALYGLADVAWFEGTYDEARQRLEVCLALRREAGDERGIAEALVSLSNTLPRLGQLAEGVHAGEEGIAILRRLGNRGEVALALGELGTALAFQGRYAESQAMFQETLQLRTEQGHYSSLPLLNMALGHIQMHLGLFDSADQQGEVALAGAQKAGNQRTIGNAQWLLGSVALARGDCAGAQRCLQESISATRVYGQQGELGRACATLGYAEHGLGNMQEARSLLRQALRIGARQGAMIPLWFGLPGVALLLASAGEIEQAVALYALAARYPVVGESRWFPQVAGQSIAAAATTLPPDVVAAARERGRSLDLEAAVEELLDELGARQQEGPGSRHASTGACRA